jgi:hypothetical protein
VGMALINRYAALCTTHEGQSQYLVLRVRLVVHLALNSHLCDVHETLAVQRLVKTSPSVGTDGSRRRLECLGGAYRFHKHCPVPAYTPCSPYWQISSNGSKYAPTHHRNKELLGKTAKYCWTQNACPFCKIPYSEVNHRG